MYGYARVCVRLSCTLHAHINTSHARLCALYSVILFWAVAAYGVAGRTKCYLYIVVCVCVCVCVCVLMPKV